MDKMKLNPSHITELANVTFPLTMVNAQTAGCMIGAGTSAAPVDCSTTAGMKFNSIYTSSAATSGDSRNTYLRHYIKGIGGAGEALRAYCTVSGVAAAGTVNGIHASLDFADADSTASGQGTAVRATLHIPNEATWTSGTITALMAEIYSDGTASDPDGVTELSFIRVANNGESGKADVDTDAFALSFQGFTAGTGSMIYDSTGAAPQTDGSIKIKVGADTRYLMYYDQEAA
jgi:hypothetical protein